MSEIPGFKLSRTGDVIPALAFGSGSKHKKPQDSDLKEDDVDESLVSILVSAIDAGFNHLDTAEIYSTRLELSEAVKRSGVDRSKLWITDKYDQGWPAAGYVSKSPGGPYDSVKKGLEIFGFDNYDLFLLHAPFFQENLVDCTIEEAWQQLERCVDEGLVRNIGVSNFDIKNLEKILKIARIKPQINQIEYNLYLQNQSEGIVEFCKKNDMLIEAYCPLTPILDFKIKDENHPLKPIIKELCAKYDVSPSVLVLRWIYESGVAPVTTSSNKQRMKQTFAMFNFELDKEDFERLAEVGKTYKVRTIFNDFFENL